MTTPQTVKSAPRQRSTQALAVSKNTRPQIWAKVIFDIIKTHLQIVLKGLVCILAAGVLVTVASLSYLCYLIIRSAALTWSEIFIGGCIVILLGGTIRKYIFNRKQETPIISANNSPLEQEKDVRQENSTPSPSTPTNFQVYGVSSFNPDLLREVNNTGSATILNPSSPPLSLSSAESIKANEIGSFKPDNTAQF